MFIKKFLKKPCYNPLPTHMPVSFLEDLTQIIYNDSLKQNQHLASTIDWPLGFFTTRFHVKERPIQLVKFCNLYLKKHIIEETKYKYLLQLFAVAICCGYLSWVFFVYVSKPFFCVSKSFFFVNKSFLIEQNLFYLWEFLY